MNWKQGTIRAAKTLAIVTLIFTFCCSFPRNGYPQNSEGELFLVTQKAFNDGFYDVAIRYATQLLEQFPQTQKRIQTKLLLGQCYFFKNQYLKAYEHFNDLLNYSEFRDATLFWLGETYLKGSDYQKAIQYYTQLLEVHPNSVYVPQAYYSLGWVYFETKKYEESHGYFKKLVNEYPDHQLTEDSAFKMAEMEYNLKKFDDAIKHFKQYVIKFPKSPKMAQTYFYIGESYYYKNSYLPAIDNYQQAIQIAHDSRLSLMAKISIGWSYLKTKNFSLSQNYFEDAETFAKEKNLLSDDVYLGKANLFTEIEQHEEALKAYEDLITLFPDSARIIDALLGKANLQYTLKRYTEAIATYKTLIAKLEINNTDQDIYEKAHFGLAWAYLKSKDIDTSIETFERIKDKSQNKTVKISALTQIGDAYQDISKFDKAIAIYDQILQNYSENPYTDYVQYRQGIALLKNNDVEAAKLSFQSLKANFPKSKYMNETYYYLAIANFKQENWRAAKEEIIRFINAQDSHNEFLAEAYHISALSSFNLSRYKEALGLFQRIIKNFPEQTSLIQSSQLNIAKCHYKTKNMKEALKQFSQIIAKYPNSQAAQEAYLWLGDHYLSVQKYPSAITYYKQFIDTYPGSSKLNLVHFQIGQSYYAQSELDLALEAFNKVSQEDRELFVKARLSIGEIFSQDLSSEKAEETYQSIINSSPEFQRDAYMKLAAIHKKGEDYTAARKAYEQALQSEKGFNEITDAEIQFNIADTYELLNDQEKAVEEYLKITYLYNYETAWIVKAYLRVGRIFEDSDQWEKASKIYDKIIAYNTDEAKFARERISWIRTNIPELEHMLNNQ